MRARVKDPLLHFNGASNWAGVMARSQVLKHLVLIFYPPEFEIGNVRSPGCFALYFISEAIKLLTVDAFGGNPVTNDARTLNDSFSGSVATMGRYQMHISDVHVDPFLDSAAAGR